jgi:chromosome partitioning protein
LRLSSAPLRQKNFFIAHLHTAFLSSAVCIEKPFDRASLRCFYPSKAFASQSLLSRISVANLCSSVFVFLEPLHHASSCYKPLFYSPFAPHFLLPCIPKHFCRIIKKYKYFKQNIDIFFVLWHNRVYIYSENRRILRLGGFMGKIVSFSNQKGGVGKTTSCVNLAAQIAAKGKKVLMIDMDPQGNATSGLGISKSKIKKTIYDVIIGHSDMEEAIIKSNFKNLWVVPATIDLAGAELELYELSEDDNFAKLAVDSVKERFDYIFIDCPPSLGMLTVKALSVSDGIVIPMQCEFYSLEGMSQLLNTVKTIRRLYNPELRVVGILLTMYNGRLTLTGQVVAELKKYYAEQLFKVPISRSVRLSEAPGYGEPICYHDPYGKGSLEYAAVAKELMMRI